MSVNIIDAFLPKGNCCRSGKTRTKKWIVIHDTANTDKYANAAAHSRYLMNLAKANDTYLSWHYTVDDHEIYHHIPDNEIAWHAGDGSKEGGGNMAGIGIEMCINSDGNYDKAFDNTAWLTAKLLKDNKLTIDAVKQHHNFSSYGKNCPATMRDRGLWNKFIETVKKYMGNSTPITLKYKVGDKVIYSSCYKKSTDDTSKALLLNGSYFGGKEKTGTITKIYAGDRNPYLLNTGDYVNNGDIRGYAQATPAKKSVTEIAKEVIAGKWGNDPQRTKALIAAGYNRDEVQREVNKILFGGGSTTPSVAYFPKYSGKSVSLVDALAALKIDSSKSYRQKIAKANGIKNYAFSAADNTKMLNLLKQGKLIKP